MLEKLLDASYRISRWCSWGAGFLLLASAFLVTGDVIARKFFNVSLAGADEITGYCFAVGTALSLSFVLYKRAHIRVDVLYQFFSPRWRIVSDIAGLLLLTGFTAMVTWMAGGLVIDTLTHSSRSITPLKVPLIFPHLPWFIGWLFAVYSGVLIFFVTLMRLYRYGPGSASQLVGVKTIQEKQDAT
ncbi:MAG: TRAP transporter small permease [Pseudomonadota bacterium]